MFHIVSLVYSQKIGDSLGFLFCCGCMKYVVPEIPHAACVIHMSGRVLRSKD
jgi:hypothetical protein